MHDEHALLVTRLAIQAGERAKKVATEEYVRTKVLPNCNSLTDYGSNKDSALKNLSSDLSMKSFEIIDTFQYRENSQILADAGLTIGQRTLEEKFFTERGLAAELHLIFRYKSADAHNTWLNRHTKMWEDVGILKIHRVAPKRHHFYPGIHLVPLLNATTFAYSKARLAVENGFGRGGDH